MLAGAVVTTIGGGWYVTNKNDAVIEKLNNDHKIELAQKATDAFLRGAGCDEASSCNFRVRVGIDSNDSGHEYIVTAGAVLAVNANSGRGEIGVLPPVCTTRPEENTSSDSLTGSDTALKCFVVPTDVPSPPIIVQQQ